MNRILPILLALVGLGAGIGAGLFLRPEPPPEAGTETAGAAPADEQATGDRTPAPPASADQTADPTAEFVKLNNQFVVPVVDDGKVGALVVLSASLQVGAGMRDAVYAREPKLRDAFLSVLFDHANAGGFDGVFTSASNLRSLRVALLEAAQSVLGSAVTDVLITDMMRQEG